MYKRRFRVYPVSAAEKSQKRIYKLTENFCVLKCIDRKNCLFLRHTPKIFRSLFIETENFMEFLKRY